MRVPVALAIHSPAAASAITAAIANHALAAYKAFPSSVSGGL